MAGRRRRVWGPDSGSLGGSGGDVPSRGRGRDMEAGRRNGEGTTRLLMPAASETGTLRVTANVPCSNRRSLLLLPRPSTTRAQPVPLRPRQGIQAAPARALRSESFHPSSLAPTSLRPRSSLHAPALLRLSPLLFPPLPLLLPLLTVALGRQSEHSLHGVWYVEARDLSMTKSKGNKVC